MLNLSLRARARAFAIGAACLVFIIAMMMGALTAGDDRVALFYAILFALVCGIVSWVATMRSIAETAGAIDSVVERVVAASHGDLATNLDVADFEGLPQLVEAINRLLDRVRASLMRFEDLALRDAVTGLPNRLQLRRTAERVLAAQPAQGLAALLFIDLDRFKHINDTLGHAQGDQVLAAVAARLSALINDYPGVPGAAQPIAARLAGDEFTILIPNGTDQQGVARFAAATMQALCEPLDIAGQSIEIGASIGVACHPADGEDLPQLMKCADIAMYHAKASGRGQVQFYSAELKARDEDRQSLERQLKQALINDEFELFIQPQVAATGQGMVSGEALLRWRQADTTHLPGHFLPLAEETGLMIEIGDWVIQRTGVILGEWRQRGIGSRLSFNVSARQLERPDFFATVKAAIESNHANWAQLEIEVSETLVMQSEPHIIAGLADLRRLGASIAIDDFGTGYSNLARLRQLPIDRLKIDRSIVADIALSAPSRTIAQAIVGLAHGLGYEVVAEGVESPVQAGVLRVMGCDLMQGFAIAQPMPIDEFQRWMEQRTRMMIG
jgi:diguanylate cyclase (GGDEF)-like protein